MKLVIQIPALDEEATLPATLGALPPAIPGFDAIDVLVVDDGSRDRTREVAAGHGARVVRLPDTRGLARAFMTGIDASLALGADVIVNTDADNQYCGEDIALLVAPILSGEADMVIGARPIAAIASFSFAKKLLQRIGSWVVRRMSGAAVADATSGFRAYSREAALRLNVFSSYTYTLETIVQAVQQDVRVMSVPVRVNPVARPSRLARSSLGYLWNAGSGLARIFVVYRPFRSFMLPAAFAFTGGLALSLRFLWYFWQSGGTAGHLQSLILAAILFGFAGILALVAFMGDLLAINRRLLEELQLTARRSRYQRPPPAD
jgi:glycosyltransferase involved in cell wall biosynthesis